MDISVYPFEFKQLKNLKITQEINDHAYLHLTGMIDKENKDKYIEDTKLGNQVEVYQNIDKKQEILFKGLVQDIKIRNVNDTYYLEIKAVSNTYLMDIKEKSRTFQDINQTYKEIFNNIAKEYKGDSLDKATNGSTTGKYIIQYKETDWMFVKRLASHFNSPILPDCKFNEPKYYIGIPELDGKKELDDFNYSLRKRIKDFAISSQNTNPNITELDRTEYIVETTEYLQLAEPVKYKNIKLYVRKLTYEIKDSLVVNTYVLTTKKGLSVDKIYNDKICGVSLQGKVLEVKNDCVKVHIFPIDEKQDVNTAYLFKYTTSYTAEGNSGWYCMPEIGDTVYIYHPSNKEEEAVSINSIRTQENSSDKITDPATKYWRTKDGKEIKLSPEEILITAKDEEIYIKINEKTGITIFSKKPISINTESNLSISSAKKINISAKEEIKYECKESKIQMGKDIVIEGRKIKNNC
ncbi:contractile injection system protein, VgrG/Pvc8 family [Defluviitalea phaphyphila]|uniref:contractile injection system protein, VgrG/Pvc8 family n=1 Tax=Defluviitalea phaphyphila TaxID=1473580 RepID=UPI00073170E0|nr:contractile injection system protein, VgrG/Pvc8 family [Defluviitalea phaphyphila]